MLAFLASSVLGAAFKRGGRALLGRAVTHAKADLARIPPKAKLAILLVLLLVAGFFIHQHVASSRLKAADAGGHARAKAEDAAAAVRIRDQALAIKRRVDELNRQIANEIRSKNDEKARRINSRADALLVRGPGKASCGSLDYPGAAAGAGGHAPGRGEAGSPLDRVPDLQRSPLIGLPFSPTVAAARQCDLNAEEVLSWREWHERIVAAWPKPNTKGGKNE